MYQRVYQILLSLFVLFYITSAHAFGVKVIYGQDSRIDPEFSMEPFFVELSLSTAAQVSNQVFSQQGDLIHFIDQTIVDTLNICPSERFAQQNANAHCSAFLVGDDLVATAGHCIDQNACENNDYSWVFDYRSDELVDLTLPADRVYGCKEVLVRELDPAKKSDYALVRLDRPVEDRRPLRFREQGSISEGTNLVVIGHPIGLPTKIASGATVHSNDEDQFFVADLDTFGGNSGSAVFDARTGEVEGILVRGARDYVPNYEKGCFETHYCEKLGDPLCGGESVSRITKLEISKYLD